MFFDISIEEKAIKYLQEKGNILTISRMDIIRGCMSIEEVDVSYKKPHEGNYDMYTYGEVRIYIQKGLHFKNHHINIVISGIGPFKTIAIGNVDRGISGSF